MTTNVTLAEEIPCRVTPLEMFAKSRGVKGYTNQDLVDAGISTTYEGAKTMNSRAMKAGIVGTIGKHSPQRYYHKDFIEDARRALYVTIQGIPMPKATASNIIDLSVADELICHSLESDVLPFIRRENAGIHRLHLYVVLNAEEFSGDVYPLLSGCSRITEKGAKVYPRLIGGYSVDFHINPNNTVMVYTESSKNSLPLTSEQDKDEILAWLGEIRQSLKSILFSHRSNIVPPVSEWIVTSVDLAVDPQAPSALHFSNNRVKVKHLSHIYQIYIKSLGNKSVRRVEVEDNPNKPAIEWLEERLTFEGSQRRITALEDQVVALADEVAETKARNTQLEARLARIEEGMRA
jgi:hypothetical protein